MLHIVLVIIVVLAIISAVSTILSLFVWLAAAGIASIYDRIEAKRKA